MQSIIVVACLLTLAGPECVEVTVPTDGDRAACDAAAPDVAALTMHQLVRDGVPVISVTAGCAPTEIDI